MASSSSEEGPCHYSEDNFQILVVGEPGCGKTSFIRAFYDNNCPSDAYSFNGTKVYPCKIEFKNKLRNVILIEFLSDSQLTLEERIFHYFETDTIVFMYAVDDPSSFQAVIDKWFKEISETADRRYLNLVFVGNKIDLRTDQQVIERLVLNNQRPLTEQDVLNHFEDPCKREMLTFHECSTKSVQTVLRTIRRIILKIYKIGQQIEDDLEEENWFKCVRISSTKK